MANERLRSLPSIERLLARPAATRFAQLLGRDRVRDLLRGILAELRESEIRSQEPEVRTKAEAQGVDFLLHSDCRLQTADCFLEEIERRLALQADAASRPSLQRVINATGVILHTNLGRAPLAC